MAKTTVTTISQSLSGDGFGSSSPLYSNQLTNPAGEPPSSFALVAGNNTIPVPSDVLGVVIVPPPTSANTKSLKGVAGDTGIALAPAQPIALAFTAGAVASIVINSGGAEVVSLLWS